MATYIEVDGHSIDIMDYVEQLETENRYLKADLEIAIQTLVDVAEASGLTESLEQMRKGKGRLVREGDDH